MRKRILACVVMAAVSVCLPLGAQEAATAPAQSSAAELAKKLANPIASLISLPVQANYDEGFGANGDGAVWKINIQPVVPIPVNEKMNLISRTILPVIDQTDVHVEGEDKSGIGDTVQSLFLSPVEPTERGWIWGAGPVLLLPTASHDVLGAEKWGLGPTAVALKQEGAWTYGILANQIWSVAGEDERADVNATFLQPFLTYITPTQTTIALNTESTYDWDREEWSIPVNLNVSQLTKIGSQMVSLGVGARYWADSPAGGADDWGFRAQVTFLFPN